MNRAPGMHALRPDDALLLASLRLPWESLYCHDPAIEAFRTRLMDVVNVWYPALPADMV